jgi:hypothetical protein
MSICGTSGGVGRMEGQLEKMGGSGMLGGGGLDEGASAETATQDVLITGTRGVVSRSSMEHCDCKGGEEDEGGIKRTVRFQMWHQTDSPFSNVASNGQSVFKCGTKRTVRFQM